MEAILFNNNLTPTERLLLICILKSQEEGKVITLHQLAKQLNVSKVTVTRTLKGLKEKEIIHVINNVSELGGTLPNTYEINLSKIKSE